MKRNVNRDAFFALLRAGLWETEVQLLPFGKIDYSELLQIAEEQSVVGLIAAGLEHVTDVKPAKKDVLQFIGRTVQLEQRNLSMNAFIGDMVDQMRMAGIYTTLVKGQGIAQCYERPLWRSCGDVDFFLDAENYERAKAFLTPMARSVEPEGIASLHYGVTIDQWVVELHGSLRCGLSSRMDEVIDEIQRDTFERGKVRIWNSGKGDVRLPIPDNDIVFVFTHFLKHFYKGGIGLRQLCDWCRLLWCYRNEIDRWLLIDRIRRMGVLSEWEAFASLAVDWLGMHKEAMPLFSSKGKWKWKAERMMAFIMDVGNFGHNRDMSYYEKYPYLIRKGISFSQRISDIGRHAFIFPLDSLRFLPGIVFNGLRSAARGE